LFPGEVTEKKSNKHWVTRDSCGFADPTNNFKFLEEKK
jgi:hypothetical protein